MDWSGPAGGKASQPVTAALQRAAWQTAPRLTILAFPPTFKLRYSAPLAFNVIPSRNRLAVRCPPRKSAMNKTE